jgi:uncharacterized protein YifN (PemK superfamily)
MNKPGKSVSTVKNLSAVSFGVASGRMHWKLFSSASKPSRSFPEMLKFNVCKLIMRVNIERIARMRTKIKDNIPG